MEITKEFLETIIEKAARKGAEIALQQHQTANAGPVINTQELMKIVGKKSYNTIKNMINKNQLPAPVGHGRWLRKAVLEHMERIKICHE